MFPVHVSLFNLYYLVYEFLMLSYDTHQLPINETVNSICFPLYLFLVLWCFNCMIYTSSEHTTFKYHSSVFCSHVCWVLNLQLYILSAHPPFFFCCLLSYLLVGWSSSSRKSSGRVYVYNVPEFCHTDNCFLGTPGWLSH